MVTTVASRPYAWPYHGAVRPQQTALLVVTDDGAPGDPAALAKLSALAKRVRLEGMRVLHLVAASGSVLAAEPDDLVVKRPAFGGFTGSDLELVLRGAGLKDLLIAGFPGELGADCTMREANDLGYECLLLIDCCSWLSEQTGAGAVSSVQMSGGIFGAVATSDDVLGALGT